MYILKCVNLEFKYKMSKIKLEITQIKISMNTGNKAYLAQR